MYAVLQPDITDSATSRNRINSPSQDTTALEPNVLLTGIGLCCVRSTSPFIFLLRN
jgi:hypothetical protein